MIMMIKKNGICSIDYNKTSWMEESFQMAARNVDRQTFNRFKEAVAQRNDRVILEILNSVCVSVRYYF